MTHPEGSSSDQSPLLFGSPRPKTSWSVLPTAHSPHTILALLTGIVFFMQCGSFMMIMPSTRIFEDIICHHYYDRLDGIRHISLDSKIDEELCKVDEIQAELATVLGGLFLTNSIPGLFLCFPYGLLADRLGRRTVFGLSVIGILLSELSIVVITWNWQIFPLRLIWATPIWQIIGGGSAVCSAMVFASLADIALEESRAQTFFLASCGSLVAEVLAPTLSSYLMMSSPWPPLLLGIAILVLGPLLYILVPETLHLLPTPKSSLEPITLSSSSTSLGSSSSPVTSTPPTTQKSNTLAFLKEQWSHAKEATSIFASAPILLLLTTFSLSTLTLQVVSLALRSLSARFHWTLAQTGLLISIRALINIFLLAALLPLLSHLLTRAPSRLWPPGLALPTRTKDYILAHLSLAALLPGTTLLALSPPLPLVLVALAIFTLGNGFMALCRALVTELVGECHVGRLYAVIGGVEVLGSLVGGPGLAWLYGVGLERGGGWRGAPFWAVVVVGGWCVGALVLGRRGERGRGVRLGV